MSRSRSRSWKMLCSTMLAIVLSVSVYPTQPAYATTGASFITRSRAQFTTAYNALEALKALSDENTFRAWTSGTLVAGDFAGANSDIALTDLQNAFVTLTTMLGASCLGATGNGTNWAKMVTP